MNKHLVFLFLLAGVVNAETTAPPVTFSGLCQIEENGYLEPIELKGILTVAESWSHSNLGASCLTCAEIKHFDTELVKVHISSPVEHSYKTAAILQISRINFTILSEEIGTQCTIKLLYSSTEQAQAVLP